MQSPRKDGKPEEEPVDAGTWNDNDRVRLVAALAQEDRDIQETKAKELEARKAAAAQARDADVLKNIQKAGGREEQGPEQLEPWEA
eukprot:5879096-Heterocapsa_arctica.AAC.1